MRMPFPPCCLISPHLAGSKIPAQNRSRSCRNGFQTTARTTGVYGTNGFCAVNHVQKIIGLERKQLKTTGNRQKKFHRAVHTQEVTGSSPVVSTIKKAAPDGCGLFYGIRENLKCSAEMNSASAKVLPAAKRLYGANVPPRCAGPRPASASFSSIQNKEKDMTCGHVFLFVSRAIGPSYPPVIPTPGASSLLL